MASNFMDQTKQIKNILTRLEKLEQVIFRKKAGEDAAPQVKNFTGAKGGILLLISKGHFNKHRQAPDVKEELAENGYHYSIQVVQTALNRLSKGNGPLVTMKDGGKKVYVRRK